MQTLKPPVSKFLSPAELSELNAPIKANGYRVDGATLRPPDKDYLPPPGRLTESSDYLPPPPEVVVEEVEPAIPRPPNPEVLPEEIGKRNF